MGDGIDRVLQAAKSLLNGIGSFPSLPNLSGEAETTQVIIMAGCETEVSPLRGLSEIHADFYQQEPKLRANAAIEYGSRLAHYPDEMAFADLDAYTNLAFDPDARVEMAVLAGFKMMGKVLNPSSADLVAGKLHPYLDQPNLNDNVLQALFVAQLIGPNLSGGEAGRVELLSRRWLQDEHPKARGFAADVYAALPLQNFSARERALNILSALVADPFPPVRMSAMHASIHLAEEGIPPKVAHNLLGASRFLLNGSYDLHTRVGGAELYSKAFAALDPDARDREIALMGEELLGSIWQYKRLMGIQAATCMMDSITESESVRLAPLFLPLLEDREAVVRFNAADFLSDLRPHLPKDADAIVVSALEKVKEKEKDPVVEQPNEQMISLLDLMTTVSLSLTRMVLEEEDPDVAESALGAYHFLLEAVPSNFREEEEAVLYQLALHPDPLTRHLARHVLQEFPTDQGVDSWTEGFNFFVGGAGVDPVCQ